MLPKLSLRLLTTSARLSGLSGGQLDNLSRFPVDGVRTHRRRQLELYLSGLLEREFGFSGEESRRMASVSNSGFGQHLSDEHLIDASVRVVRRHFDAEDVRHNPQVFSLHSRTLGRRLAILRELAFRPLHVAFSDSCFRALMQHSARDLRDLNLMSRDVHLAAHVLREADCEPELRPSIERAFGDDRWETASVDSVRREVMARYLSLRIGVSQPDAQSMVASKRFRLYLTPLSSVVENARLLMQELHFSAQNVAKNPQLLTIETQNARSVLARVERVGEHAMRDLCLKYPKLLDTKCQTLERNKALLSHRFSDRQVSCVPLVLTLSTPTLSARLHEMATNAQLRPFAGKDRALRLAFQMRTVLRRLDTLRATGVSAPTLDFLVGSRHYFESVRLRSGQRQRRGFEAFVWQRLGERTPDDWRRHPRLRRFCWDNAGRVWAFLSDEKALTSSQLRRGLCLVLYDAAVVRLEMALLSTADDWTQWRQNEHLLQLLLYCIEKRFGFSGNGVYATADDVIT